MKNRFVNNQASKAALFEWMKISLAQFQPEDRLEMIIRREIKWDVTQMRKYFEGPVLKFIANLYVEHKSPVGRGILREALKGKFIGFDGILPISSTVLDYEGFKQFLMDINTWCIAEFHIGLPEPDNCDVED